MSSQMSRRALSEAVEQIRRTRIGRTMPTSYTVFRALKKRENKKMLYLHYCISLPGHNLKKCDNVKRRLQTLVSFFFTLYSGRQVTCRELIETDLIRLRTRCHRDANCEVRKSNKMGRGAGIHDHNVHATEPPLVSFYETARSPADKGERHRAAKIRFSNFFAIVVACLGQYGSKWHGQGLHALLFFHKHSPRMVPIEKIKNKKTCP